MAIEDMDAILPQMSLSHEGGAHLDPHITADREGREVVGLNVILE